MLLSVACLVKMDELIDNSAAPVRVAIDAVPKVVTLVTPTVHAFVTPRRFNVAAPDVDSVEAVVAPVTARVPPTVTHL